MIFFFKEYKCFFYGLLSEEKYFLFDVILFWYYNFGNFDCSFLS